MSYSPRDNKTEKIESVSRPVDRKARRGFTLVELVVVILILAILGAVAAPRFLSVNETAQENAAKQTLAIYRDAIELYAAENGGVFPAQDKKDATFKSDLAPYVRGSLPPSPFDANGIKADEVKIRDNGDPLIGHVGGNDGWRYDNVSGEFIINSDGLSSDGVTTYAEF